MQKDANLVELVLQFYRAGSAGRGQATPPCTNTAPAQLIPFFIGVATQKRQAEKFDCNCFVSCVRMLSAGFRVFVVHLVSHVLLFLYSRRSSRRVLRICGTAGDPFVC